MASISGRAVRLFAVLLFFCASVIWLWSEAAGSAAAAQPAAPAAGMFVGPGSCAASACHGGVQPKAGGGILQNEYSTWLLRDKHAGAFRLLQNPVSQRMARILEIGPADKAPMCLACHALHVPAAAKGRDFDLSEGVSCESCHGPASGWLGPHTIRGWTTEQSVAAGMINTKNLLVRAETCLGCHLGNAQKEVNHEMIAAGHPDLVFELDSYSSVMPPHWRRPQEPATGIRTWAVGQAVQLREALQRLQRRAESNTWPEYAELECFACHHDLTTAERSWRQERGYERRRPGNAPWNAAHYSVLRVVAAELDAQAAEQLNQDFDAVFRLASRLNPDRQELARTAAAAAKTADRLARQLNTQPLDAARAQRMMQAILKNTNRLALEGTRTAEQAAMALESLFAAQGRSQDPAVQAAMSGLFKELENPSAYSGPRFANQMRRVGQVASASR